MIVMTVIIKMKMILLHLDNHKNASKILHYKILNNFFVFDKYKNNIVILLALDKSKKIVVFANFGQVNFLLDETPLRETGWLSNFLGSLSMSPALHPGFSDLLRSPPALSSTPTTFGCLLFLMFRHPVFLFTPFLNTVS